MVARRGHMVKGRIVHDAEGSGTGWKLAGEQGETEDVEEENDSEILRKGASWKGDLTTEQLKVYFIF